MKVKQQIIRLERKLFKDQIILKIEKTTDKWNDSIPSSAETIGLSSPSVEGALLRYLLSLVFSIVSQ